MRLLSDASRRDCEETIAIDAQQAKRSNVTTGPLTSYLASALGGPPAPLGLGALNGEAVARLGVPTIGVVLGPGRGRGPGEESDSPVREARRS